jgi:hypothetical protein
MEPATGGVSREWKAKWGAGMRPVRRMEVRGMHTVAPLATGKKL